MATVAQPPDHDDEAVALYALGLLDGDEREALERHLAACPSCRQLLAQNNQALSLIDATAPELFTSHDLRARIMTQVERDVGTDEGRKPVRLRAIWQQLRSLLIPASAIVAAAGGAALLGFVLGQHVTMDQALYSAPLVGAAGGTSHVIVHRSGATEVALRGLPDPPPGHLYQAWIVAEDGSRIPAATYDDGNGDFALNAPAVGRRVEITLEPEPGSAAQTSAVLLEGRVTP